MTRRQKEVLILILTFLIGVFTNVATGSLPDSWKPYLWLSWVPFVVCLVVIIGLQFVRARGEQSDDQERHPPAGTKPVHITGTATAGSMASDSTATGVKIENLTATTAYIYPPTVTTLTRQQQYNRGAMLTKVKSIWIEGLLEQSLAKELRIALDLTEQPDAVDLPLNALVQELRHPPRALPAGTPIIKVFDQMSGGLLILGAPGAGKTTLLLELTRDLIARAEQEEGHPIPVVFNLSSWAVKRRPLKEWFVEELNTKYDVPRKVAQNWLDVDALLPLLDGLDEVAEGLRAACVEAINSYRQNQHGLIPIAVCSRLADYEALTTKLRLQGAIIVQPLTLPQLEGYLERAGEKLAGVRAALRDDAELGELLDTPLMLSIVTLAYAGKSVMEASTAGTLEEQRRHLFDAYIEMMFQRRSETARYSQKQTISWVSRLAGMMVRRDTSIFYIEKIAWDLLSRQQLYTYDKFLRFVYGISGGLIGGLIGGLAGEQGIGPGVGLVGGLVGGVVGGAVGGLLTEPFDDRKDEFVLKDTDYLQCLPEKRRGGILFTEFYGSLVVGLFYGTSAAAVLGPILVLFIGLPIGIGLTLAFGLPIGLFLGLSAGLGLGLAAGLGFKGGTGMAYYRAFYYYAFRWVLYRNGSLPLRLVPFLDYCAERIFLRKVGGGYIFVHRLLMEHFAGLEQGTAE